MKFFLTKKAWKDEIDSIKIPLESEIDEKDLIIRIVEKIYDVNLHNKNIDEVITILFQNKNTLFWDSFERGRNVGTEAALRVLVNTKIINKATADELIKKINESSHKIIEETRKDVKEKIIQGWKDKYEKLTS